MALSKMNVPDGGILKQTQGTYQQVFGADGELVLSEFLAESDEWTDGVGVELAEDDERLLFYHPFTTR